MRKINSSMQTTTEYTGWLFEETKKPVDWAVCGDGVSHRGWLCLLFHWKYCIDRAKPEKVDTNWWAGSTHGDRLELLEVS